MNILLNVMLILALLCFVAALVFILLLCYSQWQSIRKVSPLAKEEQSDSPSKSIVGKSVSIDFDTLLASSSESVLEESGEEEENELPIEYRSEELDPIEEELEEALLFEEDPVLESSGSILFKELETLKKAEKSRTLNREEEKTIQESICKLRGTELMAYYEVSLEKVNRFSESFSRLLREENGKEEASNEVAWSTKQEDDFDLNSVL